jgi:hypothetical protein
MDCPIYSLDSSLSVDWHTVPVERLQSGILGDREFESTAVA